MKALACIVVALIIDLTPMAAEGNVQSWPAIELGRAGELTVRLRVKQRASLADESWIAIEFQNGGQRDIQFELAQYYTRSVRHDLKTGEVVSSGSLASGNVHDVFPDGRVIPPGVYRAIDHPSWYASAMLGLPSKSGLLVKAEIHLDMRINNELFRFGGHKFEFEWRYPDEAGFKQIRARLTHLLANPRNRFQHAAILNALLNIPEVAEAASAHSLLAAIAPRTGSFSGREFVLSHLNENFAEENIVTNYFLKRLRDGDPRIASDLRRAHNVWRSDFLPLLIERLDADPSSAVAIFEILRLHGTPQKFDTNLAQRLSRTLTKNWDFTRDPEQPAYAVAHSLRLIGKTHDRNMTSKLVRFLDDRRRTVEPRHLANIEFLRLPPLRVCDDALEAILTILDGSPEVGYKKVGLGFRARRKERRKNADEITKIRDKMIETLKERLANS